MIHPRLIHPFALGVLVGALCLGSASAQNAIPADPASVVTTATYVSSDPVPQGKEFQVAVVVHIADGYHMNSNKPSEDYLIGTSLTPQPPAGVALVDTSYPEGHQQKFAFSPDKPLSVYAKTVTLRMRMMAQPSLAPGTTTIPITLRYQACNNTACLRPVKLPIKAEVHIATAGTPAHPTHVEIFAAAP
jgi:thiol:disulfide interchange protein DsbD